MAFRFQLEAVLRLRASVERQEQSRLEQVSQKLYAAQDRCDVLADDKTRLEAEIGVKMRSGMEATEFHFYRSARSGLEVAQQQAAQALAETKKEWDQQREKFLGARRNRELISSVRERSYAAYVAEQAKRAQQQIDDLFVMRRLQQNG